jgi:hypothetical protein
MKFLFLTPFELEEVAEEILSKEMKEGIFCRVDYSEQEETDVLKLTIKETTKEIPVHQFIEKLNQYFGIHITDYDVFEVGDFGEGFAFMIQ